MNHLPSCRILSTTWFSLPVASFLILRNGVKFLQIKHKNCARMWLRHKTEAKNAQQIDGVRWAAQSQTTNILRPFFPLLWELAFWSPWQSSPFHSILCIISHQTSNFHVSLNHFLHVIFGLPLPLLPSTVHTLLYTQSFPSFLNTCPIHLSLLRLITSLIFSMTKFYWTHTIHFEIRCIILRTVELCQLHAILFIPSTAFTGVKMQCPMYCQMTSTRDAASCMTMEK